VQPLTASPASAPRLRGADRGSIDPACWSRAEGYGIGRGVRSRLEKCGFSSLLPRGRAGLRAFCFEPTAFPAVRRRPPFAYFHSGHAAGREKKNPTSTARNGCAPGGTRSAEMLFATELVGASGLTRRRILWGAWREFLWRPAERRIGFRTFCFRRKVSTPWWRVCRSRKFCARGDIDLKRDRAGVGCVRPNEAWLAGQQPICWPTDYDTAGAQGGARE